MDGKLPQEEVRNQDKVAGARETTQSRDTGAEPNHHLGR